MAWGVVLGNAKSMPPKYPIFPSMDQAMLLFWPAKRQIFNNSNYCFSSVGILCIYDSQRQEMKRAPEGARFGDRIQASPISGEPSSGSE